MKIKICCKCKKQRLIKFFDKHSQTKDGYRPECKDCRRKTRNREQDKAYKLIYQQKFPYYKHLLSCRQRCNYKYNISYKYYGGRGIKCLLNKEDVKKLWFRDRAYEMNKSELSRKNHNKHYTYENCQFMEKENHLKDKSKRTNAKQINQYTLDDKYIKTYKSIKLASKSIKKSSSSILDVLKERSKTCAGFFWKYKK